MSRFNIVSIITTSLLCTTMNTFTNPTKIYGSAHLSNQNYTDLEIRGSAHLTNVTVTNNADIQGSAYLVDFTCRKLAAKGSISGQAINVNYADIFGAFECKKSQFDVLTVRGAFATQQTKILNRLEVHGTVIASELECPLLTVRSAKVELKNSRIATIIVEENTSTYDGFFNILWGLLSWGNHEPKVTHAYLDGSSIDSITFQGLPGCVILASGATVGSVVNGTVETR